MFRNSVYRSDVVKNDLNPKWEKTDLSLEAVCNGDMERAMKVVVRDHKRSGKHYEMGEFETTMQRFVEAKEDGGDIDEDKAFSLRKGGKDVGHVLILQAAVTMDSDDGGDPTMTSSGRPTRPEFLDYLTGGCQISLAVAIDFTASNGKLRLRQLGPVEYWLVTNMLAL